LDHFQQGIRMYMICITWRILLIEKNWCC